jgi:hypothetical protein
LGLYNRPEVAAVPGDVSPTQIKKKAWVCTLLDKRQVGQRDFRRKQANRTFSKGEGRTYIYDRKKKLKET